MIKTLQKRFVITAMTAITMLIVFMLGTINIANVIMVRSETSATLRMISENDGDPGNLQDHPPLGKPGMSGVKNDYDKMLSSNFFVVRFSSGGEVIFSDVNRVASITNADAEELGNEVYESGKTSGKIGKFRYTVTNSRNKMGKTAVFLDVSDEITSYLRVLFLSCAAGIICFGFMLLLVIGLSRKAIRPIAQNMEKQKQFVTNAGHEIKTPLAIIQANVDAMVLYNGENKWSKNIKEQTIRLAGLMKNLLFLAKTDEGAENVEKIDFLLSDSLTEAVQSFSVLIAQKDIALITEIEENITIHANKEQIIQLIFILLDNAVKYTDRGGDLRILLKRSEKGAVLQVENTCSSLSETEPDKLFDRFYRADQARTQKSGGYGIGLSVAKSVAAFNHAEIAASYPAPDRVAFTVVFSS